MEVSGGAPTAAAEDRMAQYRISRTLGVGSFGKVSSSTYSHAPSSAFRAGEGWGHHVGKNTAQHSTARSKEVETLHIPGTLGALALRWGSIWATDSENDANAIWWLWPTSHNRFECHRIQGGCGSRMPYAGQSRVAEFHRGLFKGCHPVITMAWRAGESGGACGDGTPGGHQDLEQAENQIDGHG